MDAPPLYLTTILLRLATAAMAAPLQKRSAMRIVGGKHNKLSKKAAIIVVSVICGVIFLILLAFFIFVFWVKKDIGQKIRDRILDWRIRRTMDKELDKFVKELNAMPDPP
ncbi:hypothetical protein FRB90_001154 [Tulasnella sp. 427]|nr:hypothetical protein FRB90_001154 [Tulasnella sp. 427]